MSESASPIPYGVGKFQRQEEKGRTSEAEAEPNHSAELGAGRDMGHPKSKTGSTELSVLGIWSPDKEEGKERHSKQRCENCLLALLTGLYLHMVCDLMYGVLAPTERCQGKSKVTVTESAGACILVHRQ